MNRLHETGGAPFPAERKASGRYRDDSLVIHRFALSGALLGGYLLGWAGYGLSSGAVLVPLFDPALAGNAAAVVFLGTGAGVTAGGLIGSLLALARLRALRRREG